eukprot:CAMPEP_0118660636 /NCGR_PEP_ID=MMETSP0785-20121206/15804_1 /TAXON_ID=91992 /ORGANISM="Bolidomonas pacifica, Strain CCMP 1866" /LENGTH=485 /DNA_ID=CAMNT_0006553927 /DNA_START=150 /DNA_END=1604 /DNA_ORIENTATION=-
MLTTISRRVISKTCVRCLSTGGGPDSVCIIGSGPSGFYTLKYLLSHPTPPKRVDIVDSSPIPFGLIRTGVAPDHGDVKNAQNEFTQIYNNVDTSVTKVRFVGGVAVGEDEKVKLSDVEQHYDAVVLCHGASLSNELNNLPVYGPDGSPVSPGPAILQVRDVVEWYNAASWAEDPGFGLARDVLKKPLNVTVIGVGNVSLDLARVLAKGRRGMLGDSEVREEEIEEMEWGVERINLCNRRGVYQTAFTTKEFRDIYKMAKGGNVSLRVDKEDVERSENSESLAEMEGNRPMGRLVKLIKQVAEDDGVKKREGAQINVKYLLSPHSIHTDDEFNMTHVRFEVQELSGEKGNQRAVGTGEFEDVETDILVTSMGYKASPLDACLPFEGGRYKHDRGHVEGRIYAAGWCKRGPQGIVGTNIVDARETVGRLYEGGNFGGGEGDLLEYLEAEGIEHSTWEGWERINEIETDESRKRERQARHKIKDAEEI